jgi:hypothetical protein
MKQLLIISSLMASVSVFAQTSAYQSSDSNTSIFLDNAKANILFNVSDSKFDIGYLHEEAGFRKMQWGFDLTGKPSSNLSTQLFQKGSTPPALGGSASFGYHGLSLDLDNILTSDCASRQGKELGADGKPIHRHGCGIIADDWALVQVTYSRSSFSTAPDGQTAPLKRTFDGYKAIAAYNGLIGVGGSSMLIGGAVGVERKNNLDNLKSVEFDTPLVQAATGSSAVQTVTQAAGYVGAYKKLIGAPVYSDVIFVPGKLPWLSIDAFTRSDLAHSDRYVEGGIGLFLAQPSSATKVLGGLSLAWKNGAPTLAFVAGWSY